MCVPSPNSHSHSPNDNRRRLTGSAPINQNARTPSPMEIINLSPPLDHPPIEPQSRRGRAPIDYLFHNTAPAAHPFPRGTHVRRHSLIRTSVSIHSALGESSRPAMEWGTVSGKRHSEIIDVVSPTGLVQHPRKWQMDNGWIRIARFGDSILMQLGRPLAAVCVSRIVPTPT